MYQVHINLDELLQERNISHRKFARLTGIRNPSISEMCNNETKRLQLENCAKIYEVFECEITDVLKLVKDQHG